MHFSIGYNNYVFKQYEKSLYGYEMSLLNLTSISQTVPNMKCEVEHNQDLESKLSQHGE